MHLQANLKSSLKSAEESMVKCCCSMPVAGLFSSLLLGVKRTPFQHTIPISLHICRCFIIITFGELPVIHYSISSRYIHSCTPASYLCIVTLSSWKENLLAPSAIHSDELTTVWFYRLAINFNRCLRQLCVCPTLRIWKLMRLYALFDRCVIGIRQVRLFIQGLVCCWSNPGKSWARDRRNIPLQAFPLSLSPRE